MNSYERFQKTFLAGLARVGTPDEQHYRTFLLAHEYRISEAHVRELLIEWAAQGLISIRCWDGTMLRAWRDWKNTDEMFSNRTDSGHVRVKLLAAGAALVEDLPKSTIGFVTT